MFHKKLRDDLENDFSNEINEQNSQKSQKNFGNNRNIQKPKKLILISEEELENNHKIKENYQQNYQQNVHKDSSYQVFPPNFTSNSQTEISNLQNNSHNLSGDLSNSLPNLPQNSYQNLENEEKNFFQKNLQSENQNRQNTNFANNYNSDSSSNPNSNFGQFQKNKFNKNSNKTKKNSLGIIILTIFVLFCLVSGSFWFWQSNLEKSRIINQNCLEILAQNKDLELVLDCPKIDESWQSIWKNANLESNYKENQNKIEFEKKNLQTQIDQINFKIDKNLSTIDKLKIPNSVIKPNFDYQENLINISQNNLNSSFSLTNSANSTTSTNPSSFQSNSSNNLSKSNTSSSILTNSSLSNSQNLSNSVSNLPLTQNSQISQTSVSNSSFSPLSSSSLSTQTLANSNTNTNSSFISNSFSNSQNSTQNTAPKNKNLKLELVQKTKYWQDLENLLKNNLEQKIINLDKIMSENSDLEKELNLADLRTFMMNFKSEVGIIGSSNTDILPPKNDEKKDIDWFVKTRQIEDKNTEILKKIETENLKNPDKSRQRLLKLYKNFSGEQFKNLYNNQNLPKTLEESKEISILDDSAADNYIIKLAEKRGYQKRAQADETKLEEINGMKLQTEAKNSLINLQKEAKKDGLEMVFVSGYRSNNEQKQLFIERLGNLANILSIKSGKSDTVLDKLLQTTSIPGYSRHHTGYTFDLGCNSTELTVFKDTKCYQWLSRDNYLNAKRFGLIPSYPEGGGEQGPDPEAWEYVWVGENLLKN